MQFGAQRRQAGGPLATLKRAESRGPEALPLFAHAEPFRAVLGHPMLQGLPAILEIPGLAGNSADVEDLDRVRQLHREGVAARRAAARA